MLNNLLKKVKGIFTENDANSSSSSFNHHNKTKNNSQRNHKSSNPKLRKNNYKKNNHRKPLSNDEEVLVFTEDDYYRDSKQSKPQSKNQENKKFNNNNDKKNNNKNTRPIKEKPRPNNDPTNLSRKKNERSPKDISRSNDKPNKPQTPQPPKKKAPSIFNQQSSFEAFNLSPKLVSILNKNQFKHPSEIQEHSIKHVLANKNLVCSSPTGSGKTLAFVIPTIEKILQKKTNQVLIVAPTREIAIQIENNFKIFSKEFGFTTGLIIGGTDMLLQKQVLKEYPHVLIATPGRLIDMFNKGLIWLNYTTIAILDEVDLMLDMGFEKELTTVFQELPETVQVITYTATLPEKIKSLISKYITEYETVIIGKRMETKQSISHKFLTIAAKDKMNVLVDLLFQKKGFKIIVFFNTIDDTIKTFNLMRKKRLRNIDCIHSRKSQEQRNQAMQAFSNNSSYILLATDIAARGIDVPEIDIVINYQLPMDPEDYVHRIGRTGRADSEGKAITFFNQQNSKENVKLKQIEKIVKSADGFQFLKNIDEL